MGDVARHAMMFLVDVAIKDRHVRMREQNFDGLGAVARRPVPLGVKIEQRPVGEYDDTGVAGLGREVGGYPRELFGANRTRWIRDIVEHQEVHALVIERVMRRSEKFLERLAPSNTSAAEGIFRAAKEIANRE